MNIYVELKLNSEERERVKKIAGADTLWIADPEKRSEEDLQALKKAEIIFGNCSPSWLEKAEKLKWFQLISVGFDDYIATSGNLVKKQVVSTNLSGFFAEPVAQTMLAGVLSLYRGLKTLENLQSRKCWNKLEVRSQICTLRGARVLMLGSGSISNRFVELIQPFECNVRIFARVERPGCIHRLEDLDALLPEIDILCSALPETPSTKGLLSRDRLSKMKKGAILVNVGRGSLVDESALGEALRSGVLGGAVLDVTMREPLPLEDPLWTCPNLILTQHTGGGSNDETDRKISFFKENLQRYRSGKPLNGIVNWEKGY